MKTLAWSAAAASLALLAACGQKPAAEKAADAQATGKEAATTATGPAAVASAPKRKPGLWTQTINTSGMAQTTRMCLDETTEAKISMWGQQASKDMCQTNQMARQLDGSWTFSSVCDMGSGGKTVTTGVATGDFGASYRMAADSVTTGASSPQMNGARKMVIEAKWEGPCPPGFKPGDMELPGGMKINMLDMAKAK